MTGHRFSVGILTVSDTCSKDTSLDRSGLVAERIVQDAGFDVPLRDCVPDEGHAIRFIIMKWVASRQVEAILTLGGTGLSNRDVTSNTVLEMIPESRRLPGIVHSLYSVSIQHTPMAALSRLVAGVFDQTILVTLPGSTRAVSQCIPVILPVMKHAIHQIKGWDHLVRQEHPCHYVQIDGKSENVSISTTPTIVDRCRQSKHPTITVDEALEKIYTVANLTMEVEAVFHKNALGRVLGRSLRARQCIPPFDASIMDGYAIRFEDSTGQLRVIGALCAGDTNFISKQLTLTPGTCVRVNTGGPIPFGADCVVPVENTRLISRRIGGPDEYDEEEDIIELIVAPEKVGQFIRPTGFDLNKNDIFRKGLRLGPAELGLISGAGLLTPWPADYANLIEERGDPLPDTVLSYLLQGGYIPCLKQYRIGVLSTGNEILDSFVSENESCVRDSNRPVLINLLRQHNYYNVVDFGILSDDQKSLNKGLSRAITSCDILITSGGVSMGERDLVSQVLINNFKATLHFARVFMKPGKPTTFLSVPRRSNLTITNDSNQETVLVFCLPGNPVSCYVTTHLFILPMLRKLDLKTPEEWCFPTIHVQLLHPVKLGDRPDYRRAKLVWKQNRESTQPSVPCASCELMGNQMSSRLASCLNSNLLLVLPAVVNGGLQEIPANSIVSALIIDSIV